MVSLPSSDRAPGAIPRARCWERVGSVAPNSWYLNLVPRDSAACAHSGRHYGERTRAVPVARTRAQELIFAGEALMRTLPALAPGNLTAVLPLQQGHPRIQTHETAKKRPDYARREKGFGLARLPSGLFTCFPMIRMAAEATCAKRIRADGNCEAPTELYAQDTDGRGADSHSPFLFHLSRARPFLFFAK